MKKWINYKNGNTVGSTGSEGGVILKEEEFDEGCLITLEECKRYHAITCGVYGAMVHTAFCSPDESEEIYNNMKKELGAFMSKNTSWEEECEFYDEFVMKY